MNLLYLRWRTATSALLFMFDLAHFSGWVYLILICIQIPLHWKNERKKKTHCRNNFQNQLEKSYYEAKLIPLAQLCMTIQLTVIHLFQISMEIFWLLWEERLCFGSTRMVLSKQVHKEHDSGVLLSDQMQRLRCSGEAKLWCWKVRSIS